VRHFLTPYKEIAVMARLIPFLVRIACRYPDRNCYPSATSTGIPDLDYAIRLHQTNNALKQKGSRVHDIMVVIPALNPTCQQRNTSPKKTALFR